MIFCIENENKILPHTLNMYNKPSKLFIVCILVEEKKFWNTALYFCLPECYNNSSYRKHCIESIQTMKITIKNYEEHLNLNFKKSIIIHENKVIICASVSILIFLLIQYPESPPKQKAYIGLYMKNNFLCIFFLKLLNGVSRINYYNDHMLFLTASACIFPCLRKKI